MGWAYRWAILSQTHLVTLVGSDGRPFSATYDSGIKLR
jgi:hypothetical protein